MIQVTFGNYKEVVNAGDRLLFGNSVFVVEHDRTYSDGLKCAGRSVKNILEEYDSVEVLK